MTTDTFKITRGDSAPFKGAVTVTTDSGEVPYALNGATMRLRFTAKRHLADPDEEALIHLSSEEGQILITDGPNAVISFVIQPADYLDAIAEPLAKALVLEYDLQVSDLTGDNCYTLARGKLIIQPDVTITVP